MICGAWIEGSGYLQVLMYCQKQVGTVPILIELPVKTTCFFLKTMHQLWKEKEMLSDTVNLDFTTIPYWGDDAHLENNWSGKKHCSLSSISAVLAHDPETGIMGAASQ